MTRALLEQALEALIEVYYHDTHWPPKQKAAIEAIRAELAKVDPTGTKAPTDSANPLELPSQGQIVVTKNEAGQIVAVTRQDEDGKILKVISEAQQERKPAWHDAPTRDGLWVCNEGDDNPYRWTLHPVKFPHSPLLVTDGERWYGPIPEDKETP